MQIKKLNQRAPPPPTPEMPQAYLIDSSIYVFRGWHILPYDLKDRDDHPVNAVHGFADFLLDILEQEQPKYIACAFDQSLGLDWRREIYPEYKANREPAPAELKRQFANCRKLTSLAGLSHFASDHYEGDDIIGTLSRALSRQGFRNIIVTADKDLTQLVNTHDIWWDYGRNRELDYRGVEKAWGVKPEQIADLLALTGDKVDNIPGVPGVGTKTAANILKKFHDIDTLLQDIGAVGEMKFRGAVRAKNLIRMHQDNIRLAKQLTVIKDDPSIPIDAKAIERQPIDIASLKDFMNFIQLPQHKQQRWLHIAQMDLCDKMN